MQLFRAAVAAPLANLRVPFTLERTEQVSTWVSLLIRPLVRPRVPGYCQEQTMEIRFFAPGGLVSNLDFVESIFGNAGDPLLPDNDAALDVEHWTGHTGCVILAPHLIELTKKEVKTQISYAANLLGNVEEEHAGGFGQFRSMADVQASAGLRRCEKDPA